MELLNKTFLEFMKTDFLLSNEQFNEKYKLNENNKFLLENHFKSENKKKRIKDLINNLNERFNKLRKGNIRNKKMELIPSEKIKKLLEYYSIKKNSSDSTSDNLEPENSEIIQDFRDDYSLDNLLQNVSTQSNSYPNEINDYDELMQSKFLEHDYNYNETKKDISSEDVPKEDFDTISNPNEINYYNESMQSKFLEYDYNYNETKNDISSEDIPKEDFEKVCNNIFKSN